MGKNYLKVIGFDLKRDVRPYHLEYSIIPFCGILRFLIYLLNPFCYTHITFICKYFNRGFIDSCFVYLESNWKSISLDEVDYDSTHPGFFDKIMQYFLIVTSRAAVLVTIHTTKNFYTMGCFHKVNPGE